MFRARTNKPPNSQEVGHEPERLQDRLQRITDELAEEVTAAQERAERAKGVWELAKAEAQHVAAL